MGERQRPPVGAPRDSAEYVADHEPEAEDRDRAGKHRYADHERNSQQIGPGSSERAAGRVHVDRVGGIGD